MDLYTGYDTCGESAALAAPEPAADAAIAAEKIRGLLAQAEAAGACGRDAYAGYMLYRAERMAFESGRLTLLNLVWRRSAW